MSLTFNKTQLGHRKSIKRAAHNDLMKIGKEFLRHAIN